jgi:hypothetical protein
LPEGIAGVSFARIKVVIRETQTAAALVSSLTSLWPKQRNILAVEFCTKKAPQYQWSNFGA